MPAGPAYLASHSPCRLCVALGPPHVCSDPPRLRWGSSEVSSSLPSGEPGGSITILCNVR